QVCVRRHLQHIALRPRCQLNQMDKTNRPSALANGRLMSIIQSRRLATGALLLSSALRVTVLGRRRALPMLRHELVELFLVLGVTQTIEEIAEFGLLFLETPQRFHAVFVESAVATGGRPEREAMGPH